MMEYKKLNKRVFNGKHAHALMRRVTISDCLFFLLIVSFSLRFNFFLGDPTIIPFVTFYFCIASYILSVFFLGKKIHLKYILPIVIVLNISSLFLCTWLKYIDSTHSPIGVYFFFVYTFGCYFFVKELIGRISDEFFLRSVIYFIYISLLIVSIETYLRFFFPLLFVSADFVSFALIHYPVIDILHFHSLLIIKNNSFMFVDSNYVGIFMLGITILAREIVLIVNKYKLLYLFSTVLLFLSLNRSTVIAFLIYIAFCKINKSRINNIFLYAFLLLLSFVLFLYNKDFLISFISQRAFSYNHLNDIWNMQIKEIFFGLGMNKGAYVFTSPFYAHALITLLLGIGGIIGLIIFFIYWIYIYIKERGGALKFLLPFFISGFSLFFLFDPMIYVLCAIGGRLELFNGSRIKYTRKMSDES